VSRMKKTPLETTAEYNRPSGAVRTQEGRRIESGRSVGRHEWSIGKRGSGMTQDVLGALPGRGSRACRAQGRVTVLEQGQQVDEGRHRRTL